MCKRFHIVASSDDFQPVYSLGNCFSGQFYFIFSAIFFTPQKGILDTGVVKGFPC